MLSGHVSLICLAAPVYELELVKNVQNYFKYNNFDGPFLLIEVFLRP